MHTPSGSQRARATLAFLRERISTGEWAVNSRIPTEPELMELLGVGKTTVREAVRSLASLGLLETMPGRGTFVRSRTPVSHVLSDVLADYELEDLLVYRRALEVEAAQRAATRRTEEQLARLRGALEADRPDESFAADELGESSGHAREAAARPRASSGRAESDARVGGVGGVGARELGRTPGEFHALVFEASGSPLLAALYAGVTASVRQAMNGGRVVWGAPREVRQLDHAAVLEAIEQGDVVRAAHAMALHVDRDLVPGGDADIPDALEVEGREELDRRLGATLA